MKQYVIDVCRTGYGNATLIVEAANLKEAKKKALDGAGDCSFSEHDAKYTIEGWREEKPVKDTPFVIARRAKEKGAWDYEDENFPRSDWKADAAAGDTQLGYFDWLIHNLESQEGK